METVWPRAFSRAGRTVENATATVKRIMAARLTGWAELGDRVMRSFLVLDGSEVCVFVSVAQ